MGVYGFCAVLKNLRESNAASRATTGIQQSGSGAWLSSTQHCISGYSMMSQALHGSAAVATPQRNFDILALEILGILRKCFNETVDIKVCLYEGLLKAVDFNPKLTPHILLFLEWHFQSYIGLDVQPLKIRFDLVVMTIGGSSDGDDKPVVVRDHVGRLVQLMAHCVRMCQTAQLDGDISTVDNLLLALMERIDELDAEKFCLVGSQLDERMGHIGCQYLNCLEALMEHALWTINESNKNVEIILKLNKHHAEIVEEFKVLFIIIVFVLFYLYKNRFSKAAIALKKSKKATNKNDVSHALAQIVSTENIWSLATLERFLCLLHK